jgi:Zn-dependent M28 family amino/carboxypeptidase
MYARAVRFTGVTPDRIEAIKARIEENDGPPPGVTATGMKLLYDADQQTAIFVGFFATEQDLRGAEEVLGNMDAADTPGTRASVDRCEIVIERDA